MIAETFFKGNRMNCPRDLRTENEQKSFLCDYIFVQFVFIYYVDRQVEDCPVICGGFYANSFAGVVNQGTVHVIELFNFCMVNHRSRPRD